MPQTTNLYQMRARLRSKIHRAKVTETSIDYEGSITIDKSLLRAADIAEYDQVQIVNLTNGSRFWSYAIEGGEGEICINGAAAHLSNVDDLVIIMAYGIYRDNQFLPSWKILRMGQHIRWQFSPPTILRLDENNKIISPDQMISSYD